MILADIINYVSARTGDTQSVNRTQITQEINNELKRIWYTEDVDGSLFELDILPNSQRIITLPWFVYQLKGIKRIVGEALRLNTPRAYYHDFSFAQSPLDIRVLGRTPLFKSYANPGPLTLKCRKIPAETFTVVVKGPDAYGVENTEEITFSPADRTHVTQTSFVDISALSKSTVTTVDIECLDITADIVSIIPASLTEVWCLKAQIFDRNTVAQQYPCNGFTVLFKKWSPILSSETDVVIDSLGLILQKAVTGARLGMRTDDAAMKQASKFDAQAADLLNKTARKATEGFMMPLDVKSSPFTSIWTGVI